MTDPEDTAADGPPDAIAEGELDLAGAVELDDGDVEEIDDAELTGDDAEVTGDGAAPALPYAAGDTLPLGIPDGVALPQKEYFKIGEVARLVGVKPYVLRYWESEFRRDIRPDRTRTNQRMYRRKDVETFLEIKRLRYEEKLELPGARKRLRAEPRAAKRAAAAPPTEDPMTTSTEKPAADAPDAQRPDAARPDRPEPLELAGLLPFVPRTSALVERLRGGLKELIRIVDEDEKRG